MTDQKRFDIIIAGAGAAGLSLLWRILRSPILGKSQILLVDRTFKPVNDKTWCFWEDLELPDNLKVYHSWNNLLVNFSENKYIENLREYEYKCLRSEQFSDHILTDARKHSQVTFLIADIHNFSSDSEYGHIHTSEGDFISPNIFQSVLKPKNADQAKVDISLIQHFLGWEVKTKEEMFDPSIATFMDFDVPQLDGTSFIYLLPFSKNRALVEYTIFSKEILEKDKYRKQIRNYMVSKYNLNEKGYSVEREEFGAIPMEDRRYPATYCEHVWNIGTVGGFAKPSTGYTFSRIQKRSSKIIEALETENEIPENTASSYRFRVYDMMMLYLLEHEMDQAIRAFEFMFHKNKFDRVLRFLSEESTLAEEVSIFSKMPYLPFFKSLYKMKHRIFSGA